MGVNKKTFITFVTLWASFDLPTLVGTMITSLGLILAVYIWQRWGSCEDLPIIRRGRSLWDGG